MLTLALNMEELEKPNSEQRDHTKLMTGDADGSDGDSAEVEKLNSDQRDHISTVKTMVGDANMNDDDDTIVEKPNSDTGDHTSTTSTKAMAGGDDKLLIASSNVCLRSEVLDLAKTYDSQKPRSAVCA